MSRSIEKSKVDNPPGFADRYVPAPTDDPEAFAMVVEGDCMEPKYRAGELVVFSPREVQRNGPEAGKDYAILLDDAAADQNVFRSLLLDEEDPTVFLFRCINPKYKGIERIKRDRIVRLACAVWVSRPTRQRLKGIKRTGGKAHITQNRRVRAGRPYIAGTRVSVDDIVIMHRHLGQSLETIAGKYDIEPAAVYAAMAYYYDHKDAIDRQIVEDDAVVVALKRTRPSLLKAKLKAMGRG